MSGIIMKNGIPYGNGDNTITCTQAEYDAWEQAGTLQQNVTYYITDAPADTTIRDTLISTDTTWSSSKISGRKLIDLPDVTVSTPAVGDTLTWNGTNWVNVGVQILTPTINTQQTNFEPYFSDNSQYLRQGNMVFLNFSVTCNSAYDTHPGVLYMSGLPIPKTNNSGSLFYDCIALFNPTKRVRCMINNSGNLNIRFGNATDVFDINIFYVCV